MARPAVAVGNVRLHIYGPDTTTDRGYLSGIGASGNHSKALDGSGLTFTAEGLEAVLAASNSALEDAFAVTELDIGGTWTPFGTPHALAPGSGIVIGENGRKSYTPVATGALKALLDECIVLPKDCDPDSPTMRYACGIEQNRYMGWQSRGFTEAVGEWHDADIYDPSAGLLVGGGGSVAEDSDDTITEAAHGLSNGDRVRIIVISGAAGLSNGVYYVVSATANTFKLSTTEGGGAVGITTDGVVKVYSGVGAKFGEPKGWEDDTAEWVYRDADEGGLTLLRFGTFTLASRTLVKFVSSADEEHKVYLDGPNMGGVVIDGGAQETGYTEINRWKRRLEPGTYRVSAEFTSVNSTGGDGNDSLRFSCYTVDNKGRMDTVLLNSGASTRVHRQSKADERPGMAIGEVIRRLLEDNDALGVDAATLLLANRTFTDALDTALVSWPAGREWVWPLGTSLASALADMVDDADLDMGPDFSFNAWGDRGSDLSATVALTPGADPPTAAMNILEYGYESDPAGPNAYLTLSQDGYATVEGTIAAGVRRRYGYLESGSSGSIARARQNARAAIAQNKVPRRYYRGQIIAVAGAIPYDDFTLCDVINGRDYTNTAADLEVTDIAWEQGDGTTVFTVELGEV